jgi:thiamine biosynthesis lipoprotein
MRCVEGRLLGIGLAILFAAAALPAATLSLVRQERYCMGTIFSISVFHSSAGEAKRAIHQAMAEIVRLDLVLSHFKEASELSRLNREGSQGFVPVEPSLYDVIEQSIEFSRRSGGKFDVSIAPLLRVWQEAREAGRPPSEEQLATASRCVGYGNIELSPPNRIRFHSDCLRVDLGGIGKGYAVDRALAVLQKAGVRHAVVNAGGSTIAAIGAPPGERGWPVQLVATLPGGRTLLLRDASISTSEHSLTSFAFETGLFGEIIDPQQQGPSSRRGTVSVVTDDATTADALSTTLLLMSHEEGRRMLEQFPNTSALWISAARKLDAAYRASELTLAHHR